MSNVKTITLTGAETEVNFEQNFTCFWVQNLGSKTIYASDKSGIVPEADGVCSIVAGSYARITAPSSQISKMYLSGIGKVQIMGTYSVHCPFKIAGQGGGGGGTGGTNDYNNLINQPILNGTGLFGEMSLEDIGLHVVTDQDIKDMFARIKNKNKPSFITHGTAALFDASSANLEDNKWVNKLDTSRYAEFNNPSVVSKNSNTIRIPANIYATYNTNDLSAIYVLFKTIEPMKSSEPMIFGREVTAKNNNCKFDLGIYNSTIQLFLSMHDIDTGVKMPNGFVVVCAVKNTDGTIDIYVDGIQKAHDTAGFDSNYYNGNFTINASTVNRTQIWGSTDTEYKAVLFDTEPHSAEDVLTNSLKMLEIYD